MARMCQLCAFAANDSRPRWSRRGWLLATTALAASPVFAQVKVGESSRLRTLIPAEDLEKAARWNVQRAFFNAGQSCHAPTRMLVHESQLEQVVPEND